MHVEPKIQQLASSRIVALVQDAVVERRRISALAVLVEILVRRDDRRPTTSNHDLRRRPRRIEGAADAMVSA